MHFTSLHSTTWPDSLWGKRRGLELSAELSIPPISTAPRGQMDSLWEKRRGLELSESSTAQFVRVGVLISNVTGWGFEPLSWWAESFNVEEVVSIWGVVAVLVFFLGIRFFPLSQIIVHSRQFLNTQNSSHIFCQRINVLKKKWD